MLSDALEYPIKGKEVARTYTIAGFLWLINALIIPSIFLSGYLVKVSKSTLKGKNELPRFSDLRTLFVDGLIFKIILIAYLIPSIILLASLEFVYNQSDLAGHLVFFTGFILFSVLLSLFPMAITAFADKNNVAAAFRLKNLKYLTRKPYWIAAISALGVSILSFIALGTIIMTLVFTIIGILLIPVVILVWPVYMYVFIFRIFTEAYKKIEEV